MTTPHAQEPQPKPYPPAQQSAGEDRFTEPEGYVGEQEFPAYPPTQHTGGAVAPYQPSAPVPAAEQAQQQTPDWGRYRAAIVPAVAILAFILFMATRQWWWWMLIPLSAVVFNKLQNGRRDGGGGC